MMVTLSDIRVRDPFILTENQTNTYYLYVQKSNRIEAERGVEVYTSANLREWTEPISVFSVPEKSWASEAVWAPEVHLYHGQYYLFVTLSGKPHQAQTTRPPLQPRGTQLFLADSPLGPFLPFANQPHTPSGKMCLDGTLFIENNKPWLVYCHEWIELEDGTVEAIALKDDLSGTSGKPKTLFKATDAPWVRSLPKHRGFVTDGPFFHRTSGGTLCMLWSSFGEKGYALGLARSRSGNLTGPWDQDQEPLFAADGGHAMLFRTLTGSLLLTLHQPNGGGKERAQLFEITESAHSLSLKGTYTP
ncbi:glycoside hydrolase family 43 protein [Armatimonas sp.]|uniref:glycoside hydrolase family 43 protein n=1 Tax=Armatimonas sp. TaxID=1872638 RepID=UPI00286B2004|nr:glycoside hydrolase family 43 protein [Armatimonas sp.]